MHLQRRRWACFFEEWGGVIVFFFPLHVYNEWMSSNEKILVILILISDVLVEELKCLLCCMSCLVLSWLDFTWGLVRYLAGNTCSCSCTCTCTTAKYRCMHSTCSWMRFAFFRLASPRPGILCHAMPRLTLRTVNSNSNSISNSNHAMAERQWRDV